MIYSGRSLILQRPRSLSTALSSAQFQDKQLLFGVAHFWSDTKTQPVLLFGVAGQSNGAADAGFAWTTFLPCFADACDSLRNNPQENSLYTASCAWPVHLRSRKANMLTISVQNTLMKLRIPSISFKAKASLNAIL